MNNERVMMIYIPFYLSQLPGVCASIQCNVVVGVVSFCFISFCFVSFRFVSFCFVFQDRGEFASVEGGR